MAGPKLNVALADLAAAVADMRKLGVIVWANSPVGDITLGPVPISSRLASQPADPMAARRAYYADLLGRPVSDEEAKRLP